MHCWPGDLADGGTGSAAAAEDTGAVGKFHPGCCTDSMGSLCCLQTLAAQGNHRKPVNTSCSKQGKKQFKDQNRVKSYSNLYNKLLYLPLDNN